MSTPVGDSKLSFPGKGIGVVPLVGGTAASGEAVAHYLATGHLGSLGFWIGNLSPLLMLWGTILTAGASWALGIYLQWKSGEVPARVLKMQIASLVMALAGFLTAMAAWPPV